MPTALRQKLLDGLPAVLGVLHQMIVEGVLTATVTDPKTGEPAEKTQLVSPGIRLAAAREWMDRGIGKAPAAPEDRPIGGGDPLDLSSDELLALAQGRAKDAGRLVDAEPIDQPVTLERMSPVTEPVEPPESVQSPEPPGKPKATKALTRASPARKRGKKAKASKTSKACVPGKARTTGKPSTPVKKAKARKSTKRTKVTKTLDSL